MSNPIKKYFEYEHLPEHLQVVSVGFKNLADLLDHRLPDGPEKSTMLRKMLEAKDCAVRAALDMSPEELLKGTTAKAGRVVGCVESDALRGELDRAVVKELIIDEFNKYKSDWSCSLGAMDYIAEECTKRICSREGQNRGRGTEVVG